ncbi:MAG: fatty acid desaturase, partial [Alphaproteobacteria bacterium]|nr:fatty acid desaturase [Alphaproteobacteria bacterium]
ARSLRQVSATGAAFAALFFGALVLAEKVGYLAAFAVAPLAGLFLLRLFIIQHDCGHYSFFRQRWACDFVGRIIGVLTLTPYHWWKQEHDCHHATTGNLSRRGRGDIKTLTVAEYRQLSRPRRWGYRLYRHPVVLFLIGPLYQFIIRHRLPIGLRRGDTRSFNSIMGTNLAVAALVVCGGTVFGYGRFLTIALAVTVVADIAGIWIFFIQHQFEKTYWQRQSQWRFVPAVLAGCSFYRLPKPLEWVTGWIGYHHIHHLAPRIPNYRLRAAHQSLGHLLPVTEFGLRAGFAAARLALWDEDRRRLVPFKAVAPMAE